MKKFKDITKREELLERVQDGILSVGNQYSQIAFLLREKRTSPEQIEVQVVYCVRSGGINSITRYI